jgi:epoxyqueuosine reductase QueG
MLTKEDLKRFAKEIRVDLIGVADIERFKDVPPEHSPSSIFPEAKSVIVVGRRITRGSLRGIEEGTNFDLYAIYGRDWLNNRILAMATFKIGEFLEDNGWEAVPIPDLPPEVPPLGIPVREGQPAPNVMLDVIDCALKAGLGEIGHCGFFLTPEFGPRQRFQVILTDLQLEPDPLFDGKVCDYPSCQGFCPLGAISSTGEIDYKKCNMCKNGAFPNPYHSSGKPDRLGAICARSCLDHLERNNLIKNSFQNPFRTKPAWKVIEERRIMEE